MFDTDIDYCTDTDSMPDIDTWHNIDIPYTNTEHIQITGRYHHSWHITYADFRLGTVILKEIKIQNSQILFYGDTTELLNTEYCITESRIRIYWYSCYWYDVWS